MACRPSCGRRAPPRGARSAPEREAHAHLRPVRESGCGTKASAYTFHVDREARILPHLAEKRGIRARGRG